MVHMILCFRGRVDFQKRPHEGRMKTIAFAKDPDDYWIELCNRSPKAGFREKFNLSQTMIRVKDPEKSLKFYRDLLGMKLLLKSNKGDFTVYFLAHLEAGATAPANPEVTHYDRSSWYPCVASSDAVLCSSSRCVAPPDPQLSQRLRL